MTPQYAPLYAMDQAGKFWQVIGWTERYTGGYVPVCVPLGRFGQTEARLDKLAYLAEPPNVDHELTQLRPAPAEAMTEVIQRVDSHNGPRNGF